MKLDPFYPIVDSSGWIARLIPFGMRLVQLRIKETPEDVLRGEISAAKTLCDTRGCQLVVNDHWELAIELGCDFVHLGQEDLSDADVAAIRKAGLKLGVSTHDGEELETALSVDPDYIALGPVYPTQTKALKWAVQGVEKVRDWKTRVGDTPLVAIGGINLERAQNVFQHGADSIAVISDVTKHADPERRTRSWVMATDDMRS